jgi:hypothetical protein
MMHFFLNEIRVFSPYQFSWPCSYGSFATDSYFERSLCTTYKTANILQRNIEALSLAKTITYSKCVSVALFTQHAKRVRRIIMSSVTRTAVTYFSALSHKRHDFREKLFYIKCVF